MIVNKNYPLKNITTIGLGGHCREYVCPSDHNDLKNVMKKNPLYIGNGSNICFATDYYDGTIVSLKKMDKFISHDEQYITCSSNISCTKLARYLYNNKISGYEFLYGIPGTLGGAVFMNAGAFEKEIMPLVFCIELLDKNGINHVLFDKDLKYSYRSSCIDNKSIITSIKLHNYQEKFSSKILNELNLKRRQNQPTDELSCGCIFKNPTNDFAARLIEKADLKGSRVGGISISKKHSNYFINDGNGTAEDFINLINNVKEKVLEKYKIKLEEEVIIIK